MFGNVFDDLYGLALPIAVLLIVILCIKFGMRWRTARTAAVNDEVNCSGASKAPEGVAGDGPKGVSVDLLSLHPEGAGGWSRTREQKMTCCGCSIGLAGVQCEPFAEIIFRLEGSRSLGKTKLQLSMDQVDFGVNNCCSGKCSARNQSCDKNCQIVFIYKMTIQVHPKPWAQDSSRLQLQPHHTAEIFGLQRNCNLSFQMPFVCPRQASATYQTGNTVCRAAPAFGWSPACRDAASNSVSWTWELYRYANGTKLELNKHRWASRPGLGIRPSHMQIHSGAFQAKASWEVQASAESQQHGLEWDVKVTLHTAALQSKIRLPGYSVTMGPTLSFKKILAFS